MAGALAEEAVPKAISWADKTGNVEREISPTWHTNGVDRAPPMDC